MRSLAEAIRGHKTDQNLEREEPRLFRTWLGRQVSKQYARHGTRGILGYESEGQDRPSLVKRNKGDHGVIASKTSHIGAWQPLDNDIAGI